MLTKKDFYMCSDPKQTANTPQSKFVKQWFQPLFQSVETKQFHYDLITKRVSDIKKKRELWKDHSTYFDSFSFYFDERYKKVSFYELFSEPALQRLKQHLALTTSPVAMWKSVSQDTLLFRDISKVVDVIYRQSLFTTFIDSNVVKVNVFTNWITNYPLKTTSMVLATPFHYLLSNDKSQFIDSHKKGLMMSFLPVFPLITGACINWGFKKAAFRTIDFASNKYQLTPQSVKFLKFPIRLYFWGAVGIGLMQFITTEYEAMRLAPKYSPSKLNEKYLTKAIMPKPTTTAAVPKDPLTV